MNILKRKKLKKGFSLLELIVVIVIMAILVGLSAPRFMGKAKNAKVSAFKNDVETLQNIANVNEMERGLGTSSVANPYGSDTAVATVNSDLASAIEGDTNLLTAYTLTADGTLNASEISSLGLSTLDSDNFTAQISNKLKDNDLTHYLIITKGSYAGTILYNSTTQVVDENGVRYFGIDITK